MKAFSERWAVFGVKTREPKIDPRPPYQRGPVWSKSKKQLLMDTILRGMDIPKIYLRAVDNPPFTYEVVDGQQRLRALWEFYRGEYTLPDDCPPAKGLEIAGKRLNELPNALQDDFQGYQLDFVILEEATEDEVEEMFVRLQNGETLTAAEKRNALPGQMKEFVKDLVNHPFFQDVAFKNTRYAFDQVCAQMTLLELAGGPTDTKARALERMYRDHVKFDRNGRTARKIKRVLSFLDNAFPQKTPELRKQNVVSLYLLASELMEKYAVSGKEAAFGEWFINFEQERRTEQNRPEDERDAEWVRYQEKTLQAVDSKDSIEFRHKMLMTSFLLHCPNLEPLDAQRDFTEEQRLTIFRKYKGICQGCRKEIKWDEFHADHIVPFSKGGKTTVDNGQLLCAKCNLAKAAALP